MRELFNILIIIYIFCLMTINDTAVWIISFVFFYLIVKLDFIRIRRTNRHSELYASIIIGGIIVALLIGISATYFSEVTKNVAVCSISKNFFQCLDQDNNLLIARLGLISFLIASAIGLFTYIELMNRPRTRR